MQMLRKLPRVLKTKQPPDTGGPPGIGPLSDLPEDPETKIARERLNEKKRREKHPDLDDPGTIV